MEEEKVEEIPKEPHAPFSLPILAVIKTQRYQNGLRHNDHHRYRSYCTRRLRRLRVVLKFKYGKGRYKPNPFPEDFECPKLLEILLVNAERCWAFAMQLKADSAAAPQPNARWRQHLIGRLTKARQWAAQLQQVSEVHCDVRTQQEAKAYSVYMDAIWRLEREEYAEALDALSTAKAHYDRLGVACSDPKEQQVYKEIVLEMEPSFRMAKYHIGYFDEDKGQAAKSDDKEEQGDFIYRGTALSVPCNTIKDQMIHARHLFLQIGKNSDDANANLSAQIESYGEASVAISTTLSAIHEKMIIGDNIGWVRVEACMREFQCCLCLERNSLLLKGIFNNRRSKPEEGMRFCEQLKNDIIQLLLLVQTSDDFKSALAEYSNVTLNCNAFFLARCHFANEKHLEAAALLDLTQQRVDKNLDLTELHSPLDRIKPFFQEINLDTHSAGTRLYTRTLVALYKSSNTSNTDNTAAPADASLLTTFPPAPSDVEAKPFLLDLAFSYLEPPRLDHLVKKPGVFSKVTGVLGGWGGWGKRQ
eukprot:GEMP01045440.1.p1 GENE.GEMP01045440.1~~GEMP01045440.1.p1  ORF type:complete len:539 (+),score=127.33 GEMP01045440.1:30-1619(+)